MSKHLFDVLADEDIFGLDYRANELPCDEKGNIIYTGDSPEEYRAYLKWLSDYLNRLDIEPNEMQAPLCEMVEHGDRKEAIALIGELAGLYESIRLDIDSSTVYCEWPCDRKASLEDKIEWIYNRAVELREEYEGEKEWKVDIRTLRYSSSVDIAPQITRERIRQFLIEEAERAKYLKDGDEKFGDVGWRVPLSYVLKDVVDEDERVRLLGMFFAVYNDYAYK